MHSDRIARALWELLEKTGLGQDATVEDQRFRSVLKRDPDLRVFDGTMLPAGNQSSSRVTIDVLADWLIEYARRNNIETAVSALERYLQLSSVPGYETMSLRGIRLDTIVTLSESLSLIPYDLLPPALKNHPVLQKYRSMDILSLFPMLENYELERYEIMIPHAAVVRATEWSPKFYSPHDGFPSVVVANKPALGDVCDFLALFDDCAPLPAAHWYQSEEWVPCSRSSLSEMNFQIGQFHSGTLTAEGATLASELFQSFCNLDDDTMRKIRLPLSRLGRAKRALHTSERVIELVLGLEALFLADQKERSEISLSFRLTGAWLLGESGEDRLQLYDLFQKLYDCRSRIVHGGMLKNDINMRDGMKMTLEQLSDEGVRKLSDGLKNVIRRGGFPNWRELVLDAGQMN